MAKTTELLKSARRMLRNNFTTGEWVVFPDGRKWDPEEDDWDDLVNMVRSQPNPSCRVCAEGAVYMACALAGEAEGTARRLIAELDDHADALYESSIVEINDGFAFPEDGRVATGLKDVLKVFEEVEKERETVHV